MVIVCGESGQNVPAAVEVRVLACVTLPNGAVVNVIVVVIAVVNVTVIVSAGVEVNVIVSVYVPAGVTVSDGATVSVNVIVSAVVNVIVIVIVSVYVPDGVAVSVQLLRASTMTSVGRPHSLFSFPWECL
jgi:hypothetical protein